MLGAMPALRFARVKGANANDLLVVYALSAGPATSDELIELTGVKRLELSNACRRLQRTKVVQFDPNPAHVGRGKSLLYSLTEGVTDGTRT